MHSQAILDVVRILDDTQLRYLIVGGYAVIAHGYVRSTTDLDIVPDHTDAASLRRALHELARVGFRPRVPVPLESFADPEERRRWIQDKDMLAFTIWRTYAGIMDEMDLFLAPPFDFDQAWQEAWVGTVPGGLCLRFVDLDRLLAMKRASGRFLDLNDVEQLNMIHGRKEDDHAGR